LIGNDIEKRMDAITEVDVSDATLLVDGFGAGGSFVGVSMTGFVCSAIISFCFCDDTACPLLVNMGIEVFAQKVLADFGDIISGIEGCREWFGVYFHGYTTFYTIGAFFMWFFYLLSFWH